ncbi:MAG: hypothetical protein RIS47_428, partial [Bacteroidota bacterium]
MWKAFVKLVLLGGVVYFASYASVPNAGTLFEWKFEQLPPKFLAKETPWADSVFHSLSRRQRIAQLFMIAAYSDKNEAYRQQMDRVVEATGVGGLIFFQGGPVRQVNLCNRLQLVSRVPMMVAMDAEWGLNMRMKDSVMAFPYQMQLGAIADNQLIAEMGSEIARQCQLLGVQINFAPVVDVNNNPANPVINYRSFGEQPMNVAEKGFAYSKGLESRNVLAVAKHFPGHGDTNSDSHKTLPTIPHNMHRLDSVELVPFKYLIDSGIGGVMTAHLSVPAIDPKPQQATTLSFKTVSMLLKGKLNFMGLAFTDALNMQGVAAYNSHDESIVKAFLAGNDVLLMPTNITAAIAAIEKAVQQHRIDTTDIDKRCYKILKAKEWMGLNHWKPAPTDSL